MTQNEMVIDYIAKNGSIDPLRAFTDLGIMRLAARIADLKRSGHNIDKEIKTKTLPDGTVKSWAEYKKAVPGEQTEGRQEADWYATSENNTEGWRCQ